MTVKQITMRLEQTLLRDGELSYELYKDELEQFVDELKSSMTHDRDDYIFAVLEDGGQVAMVLVEQSGHVHSNEQARDKLKALWPAAYASNLQKLIPAFANQLNQGELPINGVKTVKSSS
jgi:hypothetical protein